VPRSGRDLVTALRLAAVPATARFDPATLEHLPEPAHRWLTHAIAPGTPLARTAEFGMHGQIRLGNAWRDFTALQVLVPDAGFVWAARTRVAGLPVTGYDSYLGEAGVMRWAVFGVPVMRASGSSVSRSAADRLAAESVLLPTSLVDATWRMGHDADSAEYIRSFPGGFARAHVTIRVAADGRLLGVNLRRWGNPDGRAFREHVFDVTFDGECTYGGITVPDGIHASWLDSVGPPNEFFRAHIEAMTTGRGARR
jgi:hypothetical protein